MSDVIQPGEFFIRRKWDAETGKWGEWSGPWMSSEPVFVADVYQWDGMTVSVRRATPDALAEAGIGTDADKPRQVRLTRSQIVSIRKAAKHIRKVFQHIPTPQGVKRWEQLYDHLIAMADHRTSDGEPVEGELLGNTEQTTPEQPLSAGGMALVDLFLDAFAENAGVFFDLEAIANPDQEKPQVKLSPDAARFAAKLAASIKRSAEALGVTKDWKSVYNRLHAMSDNGTSDGKPLETPKDELAHPGEYLMKRDYRASMFHVPSDWQGPFWTAFPKQTMVKYKVADGHYVEYRHATADEIADRAEWSRRVKTEADAESPEEPVNQDRTPTDEDAKTRPLCAFRDNELQDWRGPFTLVYRSDHVTEWPFIDCYGQRWRFCRFATKEEVEASNAE